MDAHAAESYRRSWAATRAGAFHREIAPYTVPYPSTCSGGDAVVVTGDEEVSRRGEDMTLEELRKLRPAFVKGGGDGGGEGKKKDHGRVTAGSSSTLSDGAAALVLASRRYATDNNLPIRGVLRGVGDAAQASERFTTAPALAAPAALRHAHMSSADVDLWEINEAFAAQVLACLAAFDDADYAKKELGLSKPMGAPSRDRLNQEGGAIAAGHPIGASGARIVLHTLRSLEKNGGTRGMASICIGGGQGGAMYLERTTEVKDNA